MPIYYSPDRRVMFALETPGEGDGNSVVYYDGVPVWDRFSWEATHGIPPAPRPDPVPVPPHPVPPSVGTPGPIHVSNGPFAPRMMSDRANVWVQGHEAYVFAGSRALGGPQFFYVNLNDGSVADLGNAGVPYTGETEGWFWLPDGSLIVLDGPRLRRVNPLVGGDQVVLDISGDRPGHDLWQPHASDDGLTYSATVRQITSSGSYPKVGTIIQSPHGQRFIRANGVLDESQVDRSGTYCVIKEDDDNRIVTVATGAELLLTDGAGALGHSDCDFGYITGEANLPEPGRCVRIELATLARRDLFQTWNMGYVSTRGGRCLHSDDTHLRLIDLSTGQPLPFPWGTTLFAHGGGTDYDDRVKANLDPTGTVACYMIGGAVKLLVL